MNKNLLIANMQKIKELQDENKKLKQKSRNKRMCEKQKIVEGFGNCKLNLDIEFKKGDFDNLTDFTKLSSKKLILILNEHLK